MAMLPSVFRAEDNRGSGTDPLPAGWYKAEIIKSELKTTKSKTGKYILLIYRITEGEYEKRNIFFNINIVNDSDIAVAIGKESLAAICDACGFDEIEDTVELHGIEHYIRLVVKEGNASYPSRNEIKAFKSEDEYQEMMDAMEAESEDGVEDDGEAPF